MKRRQFIKIAGAAASLPFVLKGMTVNAVSKPSFLSALNDETDRVLVLIQLSGGNDGLNTIIPTDQYDNLVKARKNIIIPESKIIRLTDTLGLHPSMTGIKKLHAEGNLEIVQSVGYPNQNRSHFRSMDIWQTASPATEYWDTGWLGRFLDDQFPGYPNNYPNDDFSDPFALSMDYFVSETCQGKAANFSLALVDPSRLRQIPEFDSDLSPLPYYGDELAFLRSTTIQTNAYSHRILAAADLGNNLVEYPDTTLAQQLKNVALLISGGLRTKIYVVSLGGFDTHANQVESGDTTLGEHATLLMILSEAISAFQSDLKKLGLEEQVVGMTFSEFGRQILSNGSDGTDHGTAAPLILFGNCVNPQIIGDNPEISNQVDTQEGVPMQFDFRDIYGSVLFDWFGLPIETIKKIIHPEFRILPLVRSCRSVTATEGITDANLLTLNYPNPFSDSTTIQFTTQAVEWVRLSVFDAIGNEIRVLANQQFMAGEHQISMEGRNLPAGTYFYRLIVGNRQKTKRMVKIE